jgi:hypothetical protein
MDKKMKTSIEMCALIGKMEGLLICLKNESKSSLDFQLDFDELVRTVSELKQLVITLE